VVEEEELSSGGVEVVQQSNGLGVQPQFVEDVSSEMMCS
jgi:hypothetical protein